MPRPSPEKVNSIGGELREPEAPLAKHALRVFIGWREPALHLDPLVHSLSDSLEFSPVHFFAVVLTYAAFKAGFLNGTGRHGEDHLIALSLGLVPDEN
mgnify:CR=1 FL=1